MEQQCHRGLLLGSAGGQWVWSGSGRSTLVLGPSRSGKTSSLVIPNILGAAGPVVSTSTKLDVLRATAPSRRTQGWTLLYDPTGTVDVPEGTRRVGWSPMTASARWDGALLTADSMVRASRLAEGGHAAAEDHWSERAGALLAPLLHAAALDGRTMAQLLSWVDRHDGAPALDVLAGRVDDGGRPADVLAGILSTDSREQSGIWSTASGVLAAYRSSAALASTEPPLLGPADFVSGSDTLYVCAPGRHQQHVAPLVVGLLGDLRDAAYRVAATRASPPVLMALDEAANIAPIPDLPSMVSEGAGQGVLTLACLQDLSQGRRRWGAQADGFLSLFGTTVVLGGIADLPTLEALSVLAGEHEIRSRTIGRAQGHDGRSRPSVSESTTWRRRLSPDQVARTPPGTAVVVDAHNTVGSVVLAGWHRRGRSLEGAAAPAGRPTRPARPEPLEPPPPASRATGRMRSAEHRSDGWGR